MLDTAVTMRVALERQFAEGCCPYLYNSLGYLAEVLAYLSGTDFPLFDAHSSDICVLDSPGIIRIMDWSGGFMMDSGNCTMLPAMFHCSPAQRELLLNQLGAGPAARVVNQHVLGFYILATALTCERAVDAGMMMEVAECQLQHPQAAVVQIKQFMWRSWVVPNKSAIIRWIRVHGLPTPPSPPTSQATGSRSPWHVEQLMLQLPSGFR